MEKCECSLAKCVISMFFNTKKLNITTHVKPDPDLLVSTEECEIKKMIKNELKKRKNENDKM
jgi:hypothetical protein